MDYNEPVSRLRDAGGKAPGECRHTGAGNPALAAFPHQMSGGMRQRIVGSIAMSRSPSILIADEPTTSLDATIQLQYLRLLKDIQAETGAAIIFITHDFGVVARMCDRVAVMYAGKIVELAGVEELFDNPTHPYTAGSPEIGAGHRPRRGLSAFHRRTASLPR